MTELTALVESIPPNGIALFAAAVFILIVLAYLLGRWRGASSRRKSLDSSREALQAAQSELTQLKQARDRLKKEYQDRMARLEQDVTRLQRERYITSFKSGNIWRMHTCISVKVADETRWLGLIESADGSVTPFLTSQNAAEVAAGDTFAVRDNRLVKQEQSAPSTTDGTVAIGFSGDFSTDAGSTMFMKFPGEQTIGLKADITALPFLNVTSGTDKDMRFPISFDSTTTLGRGDNNGIVLHDESASRVHAEIQFDGRDFYIKDNQSTNKTYHKGRPIAKSKLELGDTITIGNTEMVFTCEGNELASTNNAAAIAAYEKTLKQAPDFLDALRNLAFLLERDIAHKARAQEVWDKLSQIENTSR